MTSRIDTLRRTFENNEQQTNIPNAYKSLFPSCISGSQPPSQGCPIDDSNQNLAKKSRTKECLGEIELGERDTSTSTPASPSTTPDEVGANASRGRVSQSPSPCTPSSSTPTTDSTVPIQPAVPGQHVYLDELNHPTFHKAFDVLTNPINLLLLPIFFGSIGYSIPFVPLWTGQTIWRGLVYTILMVVAKGACGIWIMLWPVKWLKNQDVVDTMNTAGQVVPDARASPWKGALFLGLAMVARGEIGLL